MKLGLGGAVEKNGNPRIERVAPTAAIPRNGPDQQEIRAHAADAVDYRLLRTVSDCEHGNDGAHPDNDAEQR